MPDLTLMSGVDALGWLHNARLDLDDVLTLTGRHVTDTDLIARHAPDAHLLDRLPADYPVSGDTLDLLAKIGPEVLLADPDNAQEWAVLADRFDEYDHDTLLGFIGAGRGPSYARVILDLASRHDTAPDEYGYGEEITPAVYADLATAGLDGARLDTYRAGGASIAEAIRLHTDKISPQAAALADGDPAAYAGLPDKWLNLLTVGWTLEDLRYLADKGWADQVPRLRMNMRKVEHPEWMAAGPAQARELADLGVVWEDQQRYQKALVGGRRTRSMIGSRYPLDEARLNDAVLRLARIGVKPSHIAEYRMAHFYSIEAIEQAVAEGLTHARLVALRAAQPPVSRYNKTREWTSREQVLRAHRAAQET